MKDKKKASWPLFLALLILAVVCVGGVELAVCRIADPALYDQMTKPFRDWLSDTRDRLAGLAVLSDPSNAKEPQPTPEPSFEDQLAGDPALTRSLPVADPAITQIKSRADGVWLTGGSMEVRYYRQSAPEWAEKPYGKDNIGAYGCGPTAMAMAISSMTDELVDPESMSQWAYEHGHWARRSGSRLDLIQDAGAAFGLTVKSLENPTQETLLQELSSGKMAVALMTTGHFTRGGHFILLRGATLEGQILVADPNSEERSLIPWDATLILNELSLSRHDGAPLWLLSPEYQES